MTAPTKLNSFNGTGYGEKASLTIPVGPTYAEIFLETNLNASQLQRVSISLNADEIIVLDGEMMKKLEAYKGLTQTDGFFTIPLSDITAKTKNGVRYTGLVTELGDNITLEVEIADNSNTNPPAIKLHAWATVSARHDVRVVAPKITKQAMRDLNRKRVLRTGIWPAATGSPHALHDRPNPFAPDLPRLCASL
ncbi:major capsid protein P2 [Vibrio coralliilyticus]|nr:major capsid protein P2 [Vibrio coralliilyticus]